MCSCDLDLPSYWWQTNPVARKQHVCCECLSNIDPGEKYHRYAGVWDGEFRAYKMCETCRLVFDEAADDLDCICFGELWETVGSEYEYAAV